MNAEEIFDVVVVGGGPCGATAADDLARLGRKVMLLDRGGRIKPCGGAIPPRLIRDFAIPDYLLKARVNCGVDKSTVAALYAASTERKTWARPCPLSADT